MTLQGRSEPADSFANQFGAKTLVFGQSNTALSAVCAHFGLRIISAVKKFSQFAVAKLRHTS
jgi:hypothetical protein